MAAGCPKVPSKDPLQGPFSPAPPAALAGSCRAEPSLLGARPNSPGEATALNSAPWGRNPRFQALQGRAGTTCEREEPGAETWRDPKYP